MDSKMNLSQDIEELVKFNLTEKNAMRILRIWGKKDFRVTHFHDDATTQFGYVLDVYDNHDTGERLTHYRLTDGTLDAWDLVIFH